LNGLNEVSLECLEWARLIKEERKNNPKYFEAEIEENGDSFTITPSPFFMDLLKAINKDTK